MNWLTLTLISVVFVSFSNILQRILMKNDKSDPSSFAFIYHFSGGLIFLIAASVNGLQLPQLNGGILLLVISASLWGVGTLLLFKALKVLESSEVIILTSLKSLVAILASILFLHESFNLQKLIGAIAILLAVVFVTNLKKGFKFNGGVILAIGSSFFYGSAVVIDTFIVKNYNPLSYLAVINILIGAILLLSNPKTLWKLKVLKQSKFFINMVFLQILGTVQALAFYSAIAVGNISQIAPINQAQVIVTVLLAAVILKERDNVLRKCIAGGLVMVGVLLLR